MIAMTKLPVFGMALTFLAYYLGLRIGKKIRSPLANPMLIAILLCIGVLKVFNISYDDYMVGGSHISFMVSLATVSLALPFYRNLDSFLKYKKAIIIGSCLGSLVSMGSILLLAKAFGFPDELTLSLLPKSVTTAIGAPISEMYGGTYSITAVAIAITGIIGAIVFEKCFAILNIHSDISKGAALGTSAHALGTSTALSISTRAGAISGVCIVIAGLFTVLVFPLMVRFV